MSRPTNVTGCFVASKCRRPPPSPDAVRFAARVLESKGFGGLLYARVDLVRGEEEWEVMELELVEPSLFLTYEPAAAGASSRGD